MKKPKPAEPRGTRHEIHKAQRAIDAARDRLDTLRSDLRMARDAEEDGERIYRSAEDLETDVRSAEEAWQQAISYKAFLTEPPPAPPKAPKLTPIERRARAFCEAIRAGEVRHFTVEWNKSRTWGNCPRIRWKGDKIAHASGCGYDKHSAVLAQALKWLPENRDHQRTIATASGSGVSSIRDILAEYGWTLETHEGRAEDFHTISPRTA